MMMMPEMICYLALTVTISLVMVVSVMRACIRGGGGGHPEPPFPGLPNPAPTFESRFVPLRDADESQMIDLFPSYMISPAQSYYDPVIRWLRWTT